MSTNFLCLSPSVGFVIHLTHLSRTIAYHAINMCTFFIPSIINFRFDCAIMVLPSDLNASTVRRKKINANRKLKYSSSQLLARKCVVLLYFSFLKNWNTILNWQRIMKTMYKHKNLPFVCQIVGPIVESTL